MSTSARISLVGASALAAHSRRRPIDEHAVLYESFAGKGMLCNPEAIFRALLADERFADLRHTWVLDDLTAHRKVQTEFEGDPRVSFVRRRSARYYTRSGTARYLVNNATFPAHVAKRPGQTYLNTWHGTPLKAMGYDVPGGAPATVNVLRNLIGADYLLAPNDATARMYLDAYRARNLFRGELIVAGTPRIDRQFGGDPHVSAARAALPGPPRPRIVLYAPTWRGSFEKPDLDLAALRHDVKRIALELPEDAKLLLRVHPQIALAAGRDPALRDVLVSPERPANDVLAVTDVLITDYSSLAVDFLVTGRPILFYTPDLDGYRSTRGFAWTSDDWPGQVHRSLETLVRDLEDVQTVAERHAAAYRRARERYCANEDGRAASRIVDVVFGGARDDTALVRPARDGRTTLLLYIGRLAPNGITSSARSLLQGIDHDRFDVSVTYPRPTTVVACDMEAQLAPAARLLSRLGGGTWIKQRETPRGLPRLPWVDRLRTWSRRTARMRDEWTRCFGAARFDHVIDFSGYSGFFSRLLRARDGGTLAVWLHNDIVTELHGGGRDRELRGQLRAVVSGYPLADRLVSVAPVLDEINGRRLARHGSAGRFTFAENTIDAAGVQLLAKEPLPDDAAGAFGPGLVTFVTVGRLSEQKNHARLIEAFAAVHEQHPQTRLVVIGDGPLRASLARAVDGAGLRTVLHLMGLRANPYPMLAAGACFVLSSDYEGQPIVLLEARVLGLPIVSTRFETIGDSLPDGAGLVVDSDADALADGMRAFLRGEVAAVPFDHDGHNRRALDEFEAAVCG